MSRKKHKKQKRNKPGMAATADRHVLYEASVQNVEFETDFVQDTFKAIRGRDARSMREDFCGTANSACEWVRRHEDNTAIGVDLDADVLEWGRQHHIAKLKPEQATRVSLLNQNVLEVDVKPVDAVLAMNFSYWCFKTRPLLREYFAKVRAALNDGGIFFLDAFGGYEAYEEMEEETEQDGFSYIWDQAEYDPLSGHMRAHIHFLFDDGSEMREAFTYDWRLWSMPELRELLAEAGFKKVTVYSQGWDDEKDEETDEFYPVEKLDADAGWVVYIVAEK
ncbi:MAG: class I SAM-dependent methyltransferase [Gammaproteobacteria bacterium]|nr:class I SAM-dependent methyltransferase [Gammaproteobacteria bacterium]